MREPHRRLNRFGILAALALLGAGLRAQAPADDMAVYGDAVLRDWVQAEYPPAAKQARLEGEVLVQFVVEPDGHVTRARVKESTNAQFDEAAVSAVSRWVFGPALEAGKPVACGMVVPVQFTAKQWNQKRVPLLPPENLLPRAEKLTPAKATFAPDPDYPAELEERLLPGEVQMEFTVDATGKAGEPRVLWASHPAFVEAALRAMEKTRFEPARQGLVPKVSGQRYPVRFASVAARRAEILAANHLEILDEAALRTPPQPFVLTEPVYPPARLLAGQGGSATAEFTLGDNGLPGPVTITAASGPEFGAALQAAAETWQFQPGMNPDGARVASRLRVVHEFVPPTSGPVARLVPDLQPGGAGIPGARGLDAPLKPLWRGFPLYPAALRAGGTAGEAVIDFVIDRGGRVRLPRVKSATREEFGWAAATAISQWVFERPLRKGEPVDVTVSIPVSFAPPTD